MLFPKLNDSMSMALWVNEFAWLLEIARRIMFNARDGVDPYDAAISYMKGTLAFDLVATLFQVASGLD